MKISIGKYKTNLFWVIIAIIIFWMIFGLTLCGCTNIDVQDGIQTVKESFSNMGIPGLTTRLTPAKSVDSFMSLKKIGKKLNYRVTNRLPLPSLMTPENLETGPPILGPDDGK